MHKTLDELFNDPEYADLLAETNEQKEMRESLFNVSRYKDQPKQTLSQSMQILRSGEK